MINKHNHLLHEDQVYDLTPQINNANKNLKTLITPHPKKTQTYFRITRKENVRVQTTEKITTILTHGASYLL